MNGPYMNWEPPQGWDGWIEETLANYTAAGPSEENSQAVYGGQWPYEGSLTVLSSSVPSGDWYSPQMCSTLHTNQHYRPDHTQAGAIDDRQCPPFPQSQSQSVPQWRPQGEYSYSKSPPHGRSQSVAGLSNNAYWPVSPSNLSTSPPSVKSDTKPSQQDASMPLFDSNIERKQPTADMMAHSPRPKRQAPRFEDDLYTAAWVRGDGTKREGWCGYCPHWLELKNSTYWYHMHYAHGISCLTGDFMDEPRALRRNQSGWEAYCRSCDRWISIGSGEKGRTAYFRHAYKCQNRPRQPSKPCTR